MMDRAEACALRLLAQRGQAADLMPEDMDVLREQGFRPDEMSLVLEQLFALKERFRGGGGEAPSLALRPETVFGGRTITEVGYRHLRSAAFEGRARALEQSDRRDIIHSAADPSANAAQDTNTPQPAMSERPASPPRFDPDIVAIADRMSQKSRAQRVKDKSFDKKAFERDKRQRDRVISQFTEATGKAKVTDLRQEDVAYYVNCLSRLPKTYNKSATDRALSFEQVMERGDELPDDLVGLSGTTVNRNLAGAIASAPVAQSKTSTAASTRLRPRRALVSSVREPQFTDLFRIGLRAGRRSRRATLNVVVGLGAVMGRRSGFCVWLAAAAGAPGPDQTFASRSSLRRSFPEAVIRGVVQHG